MAIVITRGHQIQKHTMKEMVVDLVLYISDGILWLLWVRTNISLDYNFPKYIIVKLKIS